MTMANDAHLTGRGYWRSLQDLAQSEELRGHLKSAFPEGIEPPGGDVSRRRFLQIMAASAAMAGLTGCRWPEQKIVPFASRSEGYVPGQARQFATAM